MKEDLAANTQSRTRRRTKASNSWVRVVVFMALLIIWGGLVYSSFLYVENRITANYNQTMAKIEQAVKSVQDTNALRVRELDDRLSQLTGEMDEIKDALEDTDDTLSDSNSSREELNQRIEDLDNQLEALEKSLEILKGNN